MVPRKVTDEQIIEAIKSGLPITKIVELWPGGSMGNAHRVRTLARAHDLRIYKARGHRMTGDEIETDARISEYLKGHGRKHFRIDNGVLIAFGDAHYFPDIQSTAHRALLHIGKDLKPCGVVNLGDSLDGASISRYPRIGWDSKPTVQQELKAVTDRLTELEMGLGTRNLWWTLGNHDGRFETFLAAHAPNYEGVAGFHLKDHFPLWAPCWSVWINDNLVLKHRLRGGVHATHANTLYSGKSICTGHLHSQKVTPYSDYNGTRWGIDAGCLAQPYGPQFVDYTEDSPVNWRSGFAVFTFWRGHLLDPELVRVLDEEKGLVVFRGQVITV